MNSSSTSTPGSESNGDRSEARLSEQKTVAYRLGRAVQVVVLPILGFMAAIFALWLVAYLAFGPAQAGEIVAVTLICAMFAGLGFIVWWCGDRIERYFKRNSPTVAPLITEKKETERWDWKTFWNWKNILAMGILFSVARGMSDRTKNADKRAVEIQTQQQFLASQQQERARRFQATIAYWRTGVMSLHSLRFQIPLGDEATSEFFDKWIKSLSQLTERAKNAPTEGVDQDLVDMVRRHLAIEDRFVQIKADADEIMKRDKIPADTVGIGQRITEWQDIITRIQADPKLLDSLPEGKERTLVLNLLGLEQQRLDQLREIEIMQAVLQERYRGTQFPLPTGGL